MNRITQALLSLLTTAVACAGVTLVGAPAQAAPTHLSVARVNGDLCRDHGVTNYYVHKGASIPVWKILHSTMTFHEHKCRVGKMRLEKSSSNTAHEVRFAYRFMKQDPRKKPTIFCRTTKHHAYFLDLAAFWGMTSPYLKLNAAERHHYAAWAHRYADRHGCHLFVPKPGGSREQSRALAKAAVR